MTHRLTDPSLRLLARTEWSAQVAEQLVAGQHSKRLLLLRAVLDAVARRFAATDRRRTTVETYWDRLTAAERADPVATRQLIDYPLVGAWAARTLRELPTAAEPTARRHLDHLGALAAAAAIRAGGDFRHRLPLHDGVLALPGLGRLLGPPGTDALLTPGGASTVRAAYPPADRGEPPAPARYAGTVTVAGDWVRPGPDWQPLERLAPPHGRTGPLFDDCDPYRAPSHGLAPSGPGPAARLSPEERRRWHTLWEEAVHLLRRVVPERAEEAVTLVSCVVPLDTVAVRFASATSADAFGALLTARPPTAADLAVVIIHEAQHAKLDAVADLVRLHRAGPQPRHWAPWKAEPRPLEGLLHGVYAYLAVTDFWYRLAQQLGDTPADGLSERARETYARCWAQVGAALPGLAAAPQLTPEGRAFVADMSRLHTESPQGDRTSGHRARALAEVATARRVWIRANAGISLR